jgi:hypothetical protein
VTTPTNVARSTQPGAAEDVLNFITDDCDIIVPIGFGEPPTLVDTAVRNQLGDMPGDRLILRRRLAAGDRREPGFGADPTGQLAGVNLVLTVCEWLSRGDFEEKWHLTDERGGVVGVGAQAEIAVFVGSGSTGDRQRGVDPAQQ